MNIFKNYSDYLKDNPERLWFKRKLYGWGWTPALWQGWAVLAVAILYIFWAVIGFIPATKGSAVVPNGEVFLFVMKLVLVVIFLVAMCYWKGEKPRWQWGGPKK
ncbi:MAG: hypothetical protein ACHQU0_02460 [Candidatus Paceibacteria bacterium]